MIFLSRLIVLWFAGLSLCQGQAVNNKHPRAPEPGRYTSSRVKSWVTFTPYSSSNPNYGTVKPNGSFGVGSMPFEGLFGDLILHKDGTYSLSKDKHGGSWQYIPEKDSIALTGWLSTFKTRYEYGQGYIVIHTGDVKMPDGDKLNISYSKKREKQ